MLQPARKLAFVVASSNHGAMIVNRLDYRTDNAGRGDGVGFKILDQGAYDAIEVELAVKLLMLRREFHGNGVVGIDCGANIGVHTIEWANAMNGWGEVIAIEAQERLYYALAGNIALNNCFNAIAVHGAVAAEPGVVKMPCPNYLTPGNFGALELRERPDNEDIGQPVDYGDDKLVPVQKVPVDAIGLARVDLIKIDVGGMELEALAGAQNVIDTHHPVLLVSSVKTSRELLQAWLAVHGYEVVEAGPNLLGIHASDPVRTQLRPSAPVPVPAQASSAA
jgi:FkbM family methyltransferase